MDKKQIIEIGKRIRDLRKRMGWSLDTLGARVGLTLSTISKIERGDYNPSDDVLTRISDQLETSLDNLKFGTGNYRIGVGACLWGSCLLHMVNEDGVPENISIAFTKKDDMPVWDLVSENRAIQDMNELLTAKELVELLISRDVDMIFAPAAAVQDKSGNFSRVCRVVQTLEGGLYLLTISKNKEVQAELGEYLTTQRKAKLFFARETIAEAATKIIRQKDNKIELEPIDITNLGDFTGDFRDKVLRELKNDVHYVSYLGWEPHISLLKTALGECEDISEELISLPIDFKDLIKEPNDFFVTFDGFILKEKEDSFRTNSDIRRFFFELSHFVNDINDKKTDINVQYYHKSIAANLGMDARRTLEELKKIHFELSFPLNMIYKI